LLGVIEATRRICSLPAIPTQNWASNVADAITPIAPCSIVGVMIAQLNPDALAIDPLSTGVSHLHPPDQQLDDQLNAPPPRGNRGENRAEIINRALALQDNLERITALGFQLPHHTCQRGLAAPLSVLHQHWKTTPIGRIFASQNLQCPIFAIVPITQEHPGFVMMIAMAHHDLAPASDRPRPANERPSSPERTTEVLGALIPMLSSKAKVALQAVTNPKAWLTDREQEILDQLIAGHSVRVIAEQMGRSAHTVHDHVKNLHKKLDASSRGELIAKALGHASSPRSEHTPAPHPIVLTGAAQLREFKPTPHARPLHQTADKPEH